MSPLLAGSTIFLSAFLLFQMQPMLAKAILPWFGGSAAVWGTCLVFFQSVLFLGYLYADWLTRRVRPRRQVAIHVGLLLLSLAVLPVLPSDAWKPLSDDRPALRILLLLVATAGLPYLLLASTSPLIQSWYARVGGTLPYRYFALSNAASLAALLGYPVLVEPHVELGDQSSLWTFGYVAFAAICALAAGATSRSPVGRPAMFETGRVSAGAVAKPTRRDRTLWALLAAFASVLSLAVTNHITENIAPIPLLWVLPLAVYLLTFIVCFESDRWYSHRIGALLHAMALVGMATLLTIQTPETNVRLVVPALMAGLFASCLYCHGELARRRPGPAHLTEFYLMVALGGALGSLVVGIVAPLVLVGPYDLAIALAACGLFTMFLEYRTRPVNDVAWAAIAIATFVAAGLQVRTYLAPARVATRSFYGGLRVVDTHDSRLLVHGVVSHGRQFLSADRRLAPTAYFARGTGVERAIEATRPAGRGQRIGIIGLGAGTLAAYARPGDVYRFYEINPQVVDLARSEFTFLEDSPAEITVVTADGRLALEREVPGNFDVLVIDAFAGGSVPVHLLSREALDLYLSHVHPEGVVAFHVSNSALRLASVVWRLAADRGYAALRINSRAAPDLDRSEADWVLVARGTGVLKDDAFAGISTPFDEVDGLRPWTDDYSPLLPILK